MQCLHVSCVVYGMSFGFLNGFCEAPNGRTNKDVVVHKSAAENLTFPTDIFLEIGYCEDEFREVEEGNKAEEHNEYFHL